VLLREGGRLDIGTSGKGKGGDGETDGAAAGGRSGRSRSRGGFLLGSWGSGRKSASIGGASPAADAAATAGTADASRRSVGSSTSGRSLQPSAAPAVRGRDSDGGLRGRGEGEAKRKGAKTQKKKPAATRIGEALARLPLSKLKIVVVVWQISSAVR